MSETARDANLAGATTPSIHYVGLKINQRRHPSVVPRYAGESPAPPFAPLPADFSSSLVPWRPSFSRRHVGQWPAVPTGLALHGNRPKRPEHELPMSGHACGPEALFHNPLPTALLSGWHQSSTADSLHSPSHHELGPRRRVVRAHGWSECLLGGQGRPRSAAAHITGERPRGGACAHAGYLYCECKEYSSLLVGVPPASQAWASMSSSTWRCPDASPASAS